MSYTYGEHGEGRKPLGKRLVEGLQELVDALESGDSRWTPLEKRFRVTKVIKMDDGTYKHIISQPDGTRKVIKKVNQKGRTMGYTTGFY